MTRAVQRVRQKRRCATALPSDQSAFARRASDAELLCVLRGNNSRCGLVAWVRLAGKNPGPLPARPVGRKSAASPAVRRSRLSGACGNPGAGWRMTAFGLFRPTVLSWSGGGPPQPLQFALLSRPCPRPETRLRTAFWPMAFHRQGWPLAMRVSPSPRMMEPQYALEDTLPRRHSPQGSTRILEQT